MAGSEPKRDASGPLLTNVPLHLHLWEKNELLTNENICPMRLCLMPSLGLSWLLMRQPRLCAIRGTMEKWNRWAGGPAHLVYISDVHLGFPDSSVGKEFVCNTRDPGLIPGSGRSARERTGSPRQYSWASLVAQLVKNPPAVRKTWVWSLDWEDPLEKGKATHSSIWAWRIPWTV